MKIIEQLQHPRPRKGTSCTVIDDGDQRYVEKEWQSGDSLFSGEYEYNVEKHIYQEANARGMSTPQLLDFDDADRKLHIEYVQGERAKEPCGDQHLLTGALEFYDQFKAITFPSTLPLYTMDGSHMHDYRIDQLRHSERHRGIWQEVDAIYESFLRGAPHCTVPLDRILYNALVSDKQLVFMDFEWTIAAPHEFTLARLAVEFNAHEDAGILSRVEHQDLYHFFLLHFYHLGPEPQRIYAYFRGRLPKGRLGEFQDIITRTAYADEPWLST